MSVLGLGCTLNSQGQGSGTSTSTGAPQTMATTSSTRDPSSEGTVDPTAAATGGGTTTSPGSTGPIADSSSGTGEPEPWPTEPFGAPTAVGSLNTADNDDDPSLTADMLEIVFQSNRNDQGQHLYTSSRRSIRDEWDDPVAIDELNSDDQENTPKISPDGLTLLFSSTRRAGPDTDVFISVRPQRGDSWGEPQLVAELSTAEPDLAPTLTPDLAQIYLCSTRPDDSAGQNLWRADVTMNGAALSFGAPQPVTELNTDQGECSTSLSPDRLVIFFDRDNGAESSIRMASRSTPDEAFGESTPLEELNEEMSRDQDPWISPDGRVIYFSTTRMGSQDIYFAER